MFNFLLGVWSFLTSAQNRAIGVNGLITVLKVGKILTGLTDTKQDDKTLKWAEENIGHVLTLLPKENRDKVQKFLNREDKGLLAGLQIKNENGKIKIDFKF